MQIYGEKEKSGNKETQNNVQFEEKQYTEKWNFEAKPCTQNFKGLVWRGMKRMLPSGQDPNRFPTCKKEMSKKSFVLMQRRAY